MRLGVTNSALRIMFYSDDVIGRQSIVYALRLIVVILAPLLAAIAIGSQ